MAPSVRDGFGRNNVSNLHERIAEGLIPKSAMLELPDNNSRMDTNAIRKLVDPLPTVERSNANYKRLQFRGINPRRSSFIFGSKFDFVLDGLRRPVVSNQVNIQSLSVSMPNVRKLVP